MFNSYFHLKYLTEDLNAKFKSHFITSIFTFEKNKLHIAISNGNCIVFSIANPLPYLLVVEKIPYTKSKVSLFKEIYGLLISGIKINPNDRQIIFNIGPDKYFLFFNCYGINGNIFLYSKDYDLIDSFKKNPKSTPNINEDFIKNFVDAKSMEFVYEDLKSSINSFIDRNVRDFLKHYYNKRFDKILIKEICHRIGINEKDRISFLSQTQMEKLGKTIKEVLREINKKNFYIYYDELPVYSLIKLESMKKVDFKIYGNCINATKEYIEKYIKNFQFHQEKTNLIKTLERYIVYSEKKLNNQQRDLKNIKSPEIYKEWAETILANYNKVSKNSSFVILPQITNPDQKIKIPLIRGLSPEENAKRYFEKAKNVEMARNILVNSIESTKSKIANAKQLIENVKNVKNWKELKEYSKKVKNAYKLVVRKSDQHERLPYRLINYKDWEIMIGKSSKDNDELTHKIARPNDFWFHTQHVPGSHVIVKNPNKKDNLPEEIIKVAAGIAAFYSKDKNSKLVPVIYTKKKYVWKPRKSTPGVAACKFEKSIIVEPINPQAIQQRPA